jgi:hypothetical protein
MDKTRLIALLLALAAGGVPALAASQQESPTPVGQGTHFARQPLPPGVYFDDRNRELVHRYYQAHPAKPTGQARQWAIGQPLPANVPAQPVPREILVDLPKLPPGHEYVDVAGDILLVAVGSKMVVDGISAPAAR